MRRVPSVCMRAWQPPGLGGAANHNVVAVHLEGMLVLDHHLLDGEEGGDNHLLHLGKEPNRERWRIELAPNVA